jgi:zinc and cadmium transporter
LNFNVSVGVTENTAHMALQTLLAFYCLLIVFMSTVGGQLPSLVRMSHLRTQLLISFVGGLMLGIAFLHLFPHAVATLGSASQAGAACLAGVVTMFVLLRAFHAPHTHGFAGATPLKLAEEHELVQPCCGEVSVDSHAQQDERDVVTDGETGTREQTGKNPFEQHPTHHDDLGRNEQIHDHTSEGGCGHSHHVAVASDPIAIETIVADGRVSMMEDASDQEYELPRRRRTDQHHVHCGHSDHEPHGVGDRWMGWLGILFGLWLHTLIDGVALAASTVADAQHPGVVLAGLGTFLAIALHKPLDAFTITSTMRASGWSSTHQALVNVVFALACPSGALLFYYGVNHDPGDASFLGWGLAISAGFFICIALADLLPEVSFHQHDRGKLSFAFFLGLALAVLVESLPGHSHVHSVDPDATPGNLEWSESSR